MTDTENTPSHNKPVRHFTSPQHPRQRRRRLWLVTLVAGLLGLMFLLYWWQVNSHFVITDDAYISGNIVPLKAQTSGTVADVRVDNTQYVHQGDVLVRLDGLQAQVALELATANLADSVRQIETLFNHADMLRQKLAGKEAVLNRSQHDLNRYRSVANNGAVSAQQLEDSEYQVRELEADVRQIGAELGGAEALIQKTTPADNPKVLQAIAQFKQAY
ncbi:MAG: biotin/lipoyl-binding protein [Methylovulum sp.]|nr:biotin/lipoyl-binding protein [Methylovulum sp.]